MPLRPFAETCVGVNLLPDARPDEAEHRNDIHVRALPRDKLGDNVAYGIRPSRFPGHLALGPIFYENGFVFHIDFDSTSMRDPSEKQRECLGSTSEIDLRYGYFEAKVRIAAKGLEESVRRIPILDFMFCLLLAAGKVECGKAGEVDFTENSASITFQPAGLGMTITCSWIPVPGRCSTNEFVCGVHRFVTEGLEFILKKYPAFADNPTCGKLLTMKARLGDGLEHESP